MTGRIVSDEEDDVYEREDLDGVEPDAVDEEDGGRDAVEDEDDEEDEEGQNEYEKDGFIVDDDDEEEPDEEGDGRGNSDEEERHKKKKKRRRDSEKNFVLDEDDYELLQDNNITNFHRPKPVSKKFKRLVKAGRDGEGRSAFSDEEEDDMIGHSGRTDEEKIKYSLFGDDESAPLEDIAEEEHQEEEEDIDIGEDDEMADFIVDEEDVDEDGVPVRRNKVKKKKARQAGGVSSSALQEAHDIFGDVDDYLEIRKMGLSTSGGGSEVWGEKRIEDEFEPQIIEKNYMTNKDNIIRDRDEPERIQLFEEITSTPPVDDKSIEDEATWIYDQLISGPFSTIFSKFLENIGKDEQKNLYKEDIGNVLMMLHVQKFDIPFIAMYRKELCLNLLKDPEQDDLNGSSDSEKTPNLKWHKVLWAIQSLDTWQGSLQFFGGHTCGCVLLTADYVLTAAHCTDGRDGNPGNFGVRFNTVFWATGGDEYTVSTITPHPDYDDGSGGFVPHDVCVLEPVGSISGSGVDIDSSQSESDCWISGWGVDTTGGGSVTTQLNEADMEIMGDGACAAIWGSSFRADVHICITSPGQDKGSCNGDSGGPLVCNHGTSPELRGVTSWGVSGCYTTFPSVYARLYNTGSGVNMKDWICANAPGAGGC